MSLRNVRYIIFDLNGTLVDENYLRHDEVLEDIFMCSRRDQELTVEDLREVSKGMCSLSEMIARLYHVADPEAISRQFFKVQASRISFREKALDVIKALHDNYCLILCSDTTGIAKEVVQNLGLSQYFVNVFYSCDVGYLKSEKSFWILLMSHFPLAKPQELLVIGDNPRSDIYYPNRLGMHTIQIENPIHLSLEYREPSKGSQEEKPEYYIHNLEEICLLLDL